MSSVTNTDGRKVVVYNSQTSVLDELFTKATNLADLKKDLSAKGINYSNTKFGVKETRVTLESPKSLLPEGAFTLFLTAVKSKAGVDKYEWSDLGYNDIRAYATKFGISGAGKIPDIQERLLRREKGKSLKSDAASGKTIVPITIAPAKKALVKDTKAPVKSTKTETLPAKVSKAVTKVKEVVLPARVIEGNPILEKTVELHKFLGESLGLFASKEFLSKVEGKIEEIKTLASNIKGGVIEVKTPSSYSFKESSKEELRKEAMAFADETR